MVDYCFATHHFLGGILLGLSVFETFSHEPSSMKSGSLGIGERGFESERADTERMREGEKD